MLYMVIEHFKDHQAAPVYRRFREQGRMMPEGLKYIESWTATNFECCYQLMECDDPRLFEQWTAHWKDLIDFEIVPVVSSKEAAEAMAQRLS
ncbi:MAG TPA: DUF3303 family protein [Pyrinomonadaceae bacterium]|jgi:hypothetical protein